MLIISLVLGFKMVTALHLFRLDSVNDLAAEPMESDTLAYIANRLRQIESSCEVN